MINKKKKKHMLRTTYYRIKYFIIDIFSTYMVYFNKLVTFTIVFTFVALLNSLVL